MTAQADAPFRSELSDITRLQARSSSGGMVPLASVVTLHDTTVPYRVVRYNMYPTAELQGATAPGYSSGQALETMQGLAGKLLPQGFKYEWTELAYQQQKAGNTGILVFGLAVIFVFLFLAANYESLVLPLAVILIVPMCILAAMLGVNILGLDNNILTQIGMVVLIGLAAKNAILIVEFARQGEEQGLGLRAAVERAAHQRLRPIVMTSIAFIFGTLPLVIAKGPGFEMRQALGVAVCFGMAGVTGFGLIFTPAFYVMARAAGRLGWRAMGADPAEANGVKSVRSLIATLLLSGCVVGPNYKKPVAPPSESGRFVEGRASPAVAETPTEADWWRLFDQPALDRLVAEALAHNTDIRVAAANLQKARAILSEARTARLPVTELDTSFTRERTRLTTGPTPGAPATFNYYTLGFDASYEVDLFGGVTRSIQAAHHDAAAAEAALNAARVSVAAETARSYAQACSVADQAAVARETTKLQDQTVEMTKRLFDAGRNSRLEYSQAVALAEATRATIPGFEAEHRAALYALAVLTGHPPSEVDHDRGRVRDHAAGQGRNPGRRRRRPASPPSGRSSSRAQPRRRYGADRRRHRRHVSQDHPARLGRARLRHASAISTRIVELQLLLRAADQLELPQSGRGQGAAAESGAGAGRCVACRFRRDGADRAERGRAGARALCRAARPQRLAGPRGCGQRRRGQSVSHPLQCGVGQLPAIARRRASARAGAGGVGGIECRCRRRAGQPVQGAWRRLGKCAAGGGADA